jgi:hypothetical protein
MRRVRIHPQRCLLQAAIISCLAGCAPPSPSRPDVERHRCVETPSGLVECSLIDKADTSGALSGAAVERGHSSEIGGHHRRLHGLPQLGQVCTHPR